LIRAYCVPGDAIVTSRAAFVAYKICAQVHGVRTLEAELTADLRFDLPAMLDLLRKDLRARIVFIANPNNPTGTYVTTRELTAFLTEVAKVRGGDCLVVLDSAYAEYVSAKDLPDSVEPMVSRACESAMASRLRNWWVISTRFACPST
jgi:histidinol-phosphate aminotransferase